MVCLVQKLEQMRYNVRKCSYAAATLWNYLHSTDLKKTVSAFTNRLRTYFQTALLQEVTFFYVFLCTVFIVS